MSDQNWGWAIEQYGPPDTDDNEFDEVADGVEKPDYAPQIRELMRTLGDQPDAVRPRSPIFSLNHFYSGECGGWVIPEGACASEGDTYDAGLDAYSDSPRKAVQLDKMVRCECGKFTDRYIQLSGSMAQIIMGIMGVEVPDTIEF